MAAATMPLIISSSPAACTAGEQRGRFCAQGALSPTRIPLSKSCLNLSRRRVAFTQEKTIRRGALHVAAVFNIDDDPILKEALKEPVAFFGGVFAGLLRLDLNEEPLREWVEKTAEAAGIKLELDEKEDEDKPVDISIE